MANDVGSDGIEAAINAALPNLDGHEDGDMLIEWVVVAYVENASSDEAGYPMLYSNGEMPSHRVRGLLETGLYKIGLHD